MKLIVALAVTLSGLALAACNQDRSAEAPPPRPKS